MYPSRLTLKRRWGLKKLWLGKPFAASFGRYDLSKFEIKSFERNSLAWLDGKEYAVNQPRIENGFLLLEDTATGYVNNQGFDYVYEEDNTEYTQTHNNTIWIATKGLTTRWGVIVPSCSVPEGKFFCYFEFLTDPDFPPPSRIIFSGSKGNKLHFGLNFDANGNLIDLSGANVIHTELVEQGVTQDNQQYYVIASNDANDHVTSVRFGAYSTSIAEDVHKFGLRNIFISSSFEQVKSSWIPVSSSPVTRVAEHAILQRKL